MDRRTLWAVMLMMLIALVPTFFMKKPARPVAGVVDSTTSDSAAVAPAMTPAIATPTTSGAASAPVSGAHVDTIAVTTPLARYGFSSRGATLTSLDLTRYRSTAPASKGQPVELLRPGVPLLGVWVISGADTLRLDQWDFKVDPASVTVGTEPASVTFKAQQAGHAVQLRYTFSPNDYEVGVTGSVSGITAAGGQLILGLGAGVANTEADSTDNFRAAALVTYGGSAERHDLAKLNAGETATFSGPFSWTALKSKYFVTAVLAFDSTGGQLSGVSATPPATGGQAPHGRHDAAAHAHRHERRFRLHALCRPNGVRPAQAHRARLR